ncbi:hypothetical protein OG455_27725 [Kitasatospora sp. NBC_01287]|uniref:helix-turn-helix domain-containing protein n=1 Tax=Kitasatospora sp. NBC_01287 TaxID=2903573 RepID=UPI00225BC1C6|nr:helix-turn-helix domain-containing protein [Kitasatospora sp. NBC_01287]MCX4749251.1 hypothetical protein [Kitasatospora sp. NBC_01287]
MSIHLMLAAAYLPAGAVTPTEKLALMKIADSADDETRLARPGVRRLAAWTGVGEKRAITLVTALVKKGLVDRVEVGKPGRAAVYRVFPLGVPPIPDSEELQARFTAAAKAPRNKRLARKGVVRAKPSAPARMGGPQAEEGPAEDGFPQGNPPAGREQVPGGEPSRFPSGNPAGSPGGTPSVPSSVPRSVPSPQPPTAGAAGGPQEQAGEDPEGPCSRHRRVARNCRACGTSARAQREARDKEQREAGRRGDQEHIEGFLREGREMRELVEQKAQEVEAARQEAMRVAREARERHKYHE